MERSYTIKDFLEVRSAGDGSFSPDGNKVAYLDTTPGTAQVFLMSLKDGSSRQLTDFEDSVGFAQFSPTNNIIIFGKSQGGNERTQLFLLDIETNIITALTENSEVRHNFGGWSMNGRQICYASNERNGKDFDIYLMDIESREKHCIFKQGGWCAAEGFSPKGKYVVVRQEHTNANTDLYVCELQTGAVRHITPHTGDISHGEVAWLSDESAFFFLQDKEREFRGLARYIIAQQETQYLLTPEWDIEHIAMDSGGERIALTLNEEGFGRLSLYKVNGLVPLDYILPPGNIYRVKFSQDGSRILFNLGSSTHTLDMWVFDFVSGEARQLTHSRQGVPPEIMVEPQLIRYESFDGLSIPAFLYKPKVMEAGHKFPVIINIHGGPEAQYLPVYLSVVQYLVYSGYAVVAPNIRGSSGYGKSYMSLDNIEKRMDSIKDIVALRDYIAQTTDLNSEKIALYGASYGGFMVLACLAFYPKLWAAGIDIVGISNFITFLENTADYRRALREAEYGSLEKDRAFLEKISPINSIEKIEAPLFLIHGANDPRVPLSEAEQVVTRLSATGKHAELLVYPDEGHGLMKLKNRLDAYPKAVEFLRKVLS